MKCSSETLGMKVVIHDEFRKEFLSVGSEEDLADLVSHLAAYPEDGDPVVDGFDLLRRFPWKGRGAKAKRSLVLYGFDPRGEGTLALIGCIGEDGDDGRRRQLDPLEWVVRADRVIGLINKIQDLLTGLAGYFRDDLAAVGLPEDERSGPWPPRGRTSDTS